MVKKISFFVVMVTCLTAVGCLGGWGGSSSTRDPAYDRPARSGAAPQGQSAPRAVRSPGGVNLFRLPMVDGQPVMVKAPAVLFFFTSWCGYCKQVMPEFSRMADRMRSQGWRVYGIDVGEGPQKVQQVIQQFQPNFPVLLDQQSLVARQYGVKGYPTFVVIDENANILYNDHELPRNF